MNWMAKLFSGGVKEVIHETGEALDSLFTSDEERLQAKQILEKMKATMQLKAQDQADKAEIIFNGQFNKRIAEQEGTAKDLLQLPVIGRIMIFFRGAQRPVWGFGVLYFDFQVFSSVWTIPAGTMESAFWIINFLVLGFLFGERAVKNVLPLVTQFLASKVK